MAWTYEQIVTLIPNTTMQKMNLDGVHKTYTIQANEGYVLHDRVRGWTDIDPDTGDENFIRGYTVNQTTCSASYDFATSIITDNNGTQRTAYGSREFFAVLESEVPADQIF